MSSHDRAPSEESALTSLSSEEDVVRSADVSFGSDASYISTRSREFMNDVKRIMDSSMPLAQLVDRAERLVKKLSSSDEFNKLPPNGPKSDLMLDRVLTAMLSSAYACGGEGGVRYTAAAIYACRYEDSEMTLRYLQSLGTTWVSHLLFVLRGNASHKTQLNSTPSEQATPTWDRTAVELEAGAPENREANRILNTTVQVLKRDGYQCVVTGLRDKSHPLSPPSQNPIKANASHIFRRAIAVYDGDDPDSKTSRSALVTLDILRHYASLPDNFVESIASIIDDPSNGMTLEYNAHVGFDDFGWSLRAVEGTPNTYKIVYHVEGVGHGLLLPHKEEITFVDSSPKFSQSSSPARKKQRTTRSGNAEEVQNVQGIPLPDPLFLRIHHALAGVLHMSGAAEAIDLVLERFDKGKPGAVLVGADFEDLWTHEMLRESIVSMQQMKVH
ncbi:hypothetical protein BS47DRAFT_1394394 [Hydnum rufescens UP504]|uniref:HNH nuclease domain-containing protein n=1 Tax=Hydnum rufescens UP504 TaxID=1448309 RepID=A0A9P6AVQ0_9AGAM|nr:hypothetical protein BS47DRAFT_1394394 [Hydnum rufescens UP504]